MEEEEERRGDDADESVRFLCVFARAFIEQRYERDVSAVSSLHQKERREGEKTRKRARVRVSLTAGVTGCSEATNGRTVPLKGMVAVLLASSSSMKPFRVLLRVM